MIRTLPILMGAVMLSLNSFAQINENFENGLESLSANCWQFDNVKYTKKGDNPDYVMNGHGSMYSNPPVNNTNYRRLATPFLDVSGVLSISFVYQLSSPLKDGATRIIEIGLEDKQGNFNFLDRITLDGSSAMAPQNYSGNKEVSTGVYRLVIKMGGQLGDGNCRVVMDDLSIGASYHYNNHCNAAPVAADDSYTGLKGSVYQGSSVLANDQEPDGEQMTAALVTGSPDGVVNFNADGSFSFAPDPLFKGDSTSFTYRLTDDGYTPATSNTATVTIRFEEAAPLVNLIDFDGKMNKEKVQLNWEVGFNEMIDHFELEKSTDGAAFTTAKVTRASVKTGIEKYDAQEEATASKLMYRLKLVSTNGSVEFSRTISLSTKNGDDKAPLSIVNNPVVSSLMLNYHSSDPGMVMISISSNRGVTIYSGQYTAAPGTNLYQVQAAGRLKAGAYIVTITTAKGEKYSLLFVKL